MARELATAGWLTATPGTVRPPRYRQPVVLLLDATENDAGKGAATTQIRQDLPGVPVLFLSTHETFEFLLDASTLPGDDYLLAPFTPGGYCEATAVAYPPRQCQPW